MIKESKVWAFAPCVYPFEILITKDFNEDELKKSFSAVNMDESVGYITDEFHADDFTTARVVNVVRNSNNRRYIIIMMFKPDDIGAGICAHESLHLTNAYLQYLGITPCRAYDDEQYAYFLQWVTNCMWSVLMDEPQTMKGKLLR